MHERWRKRGDITGDSVQEQEQAFTHQHHDLTTIIPEIPHLSMVLFFFFFFFFAKGPVGALHVKERVRRQGQDDKKRSGRKR